MRAHTSLGDRLEAAEFRPSGFDYMRIILSLSVLFVHSFTNGGGKDLAGKVFWDTPILDSLTLSILPMFFALSGFLVTSSLYRCKTLVSFLGLRAFRIYPALAIEVLLTGFLLGPIITTLPLQDYFTSDGFVRYLMNVTGHTTVYLPGAFANNPQPDIANGQLWTVPWELICYIAIALTAFFGGRRRPVFLAVGLVLTIGLSLIHHGLKSDWHFTPYTGAIAGRLLVVSFMAGVVIYAYRDRIPVGRVHIAIAAFLAVLLLGYTFMGQYIAVLLVAYLTCALGVMNPPRIKLLQHADLSYGVFLYHFIVQQSLMHFLHGLQTWYWCLLASLPLSILIALLSWHFVECPVLKNKSLVFRLENTWLRWKGTSVPISTLQD